MTALENLIKQQEADEIAASDERKQEAVGRAAGNIAAGFSRPSRTAVEMLQGTKPQDMSGQFAESGERFAQISAMNRADRQRQIMDQYKRSMAQGELLGEQEQFQQKETLARDKLAQDAAEKQAAREFDIQKLLLQSRLAKEGKKEQSTADYQLSDGMVFNKRTGEYKPIEGMEGKPRITTKDLTPGQKKLDEEFAKDYAEYVASGGSADVAKNIAQLKNVSKQLGSSSFLTGPIVGNLPFRSTFMPKSTQAQEDVQEVVQRNLRLVLGAQFTAKEGELLLARAYNPRLDEKENQKRVDRLVKQIELAAKAKKDAVDYFAENGTLKGFKGKVYTKADFENIFDDEQGKDGEAIAAPGQQPATQKPKQVVQDGIIYTLNEQTGEYE
jgi:hypothetical protein